MGNSPQDATSMRVTGESHNPADLASAVHLELLRRGASPPPLAELIELFDSMFYASLKTEESNAVLFHITFVDPQKPDPKPPTRVVNDR
jgi:hypothetical protein